MNGDRNAEFLHVLHHLFDFVLVFGSPLIHRLKNVPNLSDQQGEDEQGEQVSDDDENVFKARFRTGNVSDGRSDFEAVVKRIGIGAHSRLIVQFVDPIIVHAVANFIVGEEKVDAGIDVNGENDVE